MHWNQQPSFPNECNDCFESFTFYFDSNELLKHANKALILKNASSVLLNLEMWVPMLLPISLPVCVSTATDGLVSALLSYWKKMFKHFTTRLSVSRRQWQKKAFTDREKGKIIPVWLPGDGNQTFISSKNGHWFLSRIFQLFTPKKTKPKYVDFLNSMHDNELVWLTHIFMFWQISY